MNCWCRGLAPNQLLSNLMFCRPDLAHKRWRTSFSVRLQWPLIKLDGLNHLKNLIHWSQILLHKFHNHSDFGINFKLWFTKIANRTLNTSTDILIQESFQTVFFIAVRNRSLEFDWSYGEIAHGCIRHQLEKIWTTLVVLIPTPRTTRYTRNPLKALWTNHCQTNTAWLLMQLRPYLQDQIRIQIPQARPQLG